MPSTVKTLITTRMGGISKAPFDGFNLGVHVGDSPDSVGINREMLSRHLPSKPYWLNQVHGVDVIEVGESVQSTPSADGSYTNKKHQVCCVMTADCLPVLFCNSQGTQVAAIHAGWRGLLDGILEVAINKFHPNDRVYAYLGPAIGPSSFEVGEEVKEAFINTDSGVHVAFQPSVVPRKWLADLYELARSRLKSVGVTDVYGGEYCTFIEAERFFSYRRDGQTGRMASCIWIE